MPICLSISMVSLSTCTPPKCATPLIIQLQKWEHSNHMAPARMHVYMLVATWWLDGASKVVSLAPQSDLVRAPALTGRVNTERR
jgi:hypothetical protein